VNDLPAHLQHVKGKRLQPLCRRLGIDFRPGLASFIEYLPNRSAPVLDGVVVRRKDAPRLLHEVAERDDRLREKSRREADQLSVCAALFTLNRRAKRCRDLARKAYNNRQHRLAGQYREEKEDLYRKKGKTLHHLVADRVLTRTGYHRFEAACWAEILTGEGYTFHRPCRPPKPIPEDADRNSIEAKPKGLKEPTLNVAREVVEKYLHARLGVQVYQWGSADDEDEDGWAPVFGDGEEDDDDEDF
jgi:hypothetical protein